MGHVLEGRERGVHAEVRRKSFVLYTDFGEQRMELDWKHLDELPDLIARLKQQQPGRAAEVVTKTRAEIEAMIGRIESDDRYKYPAANVEINAPLALIQVEMKAQVRALKWALGLIKNIGTSAT